MTSYVLDASAGLRLHLDDGPMPEGLESAAELVADGEARFVAPELFWVEVAHVLLRSRRKGLLRPRDFHDTWENLLGGSLHTLRHLEYLDEAMHLAGEDNLSVYDAMYLALSMKHEWPLFTADKKLRQAARRRGLLATVDD
jgi:predicted nucleic acid-binding protein